MLAGSKSIRALMSLVALIAALDSPNAAAMTCMRHGLDSSYGDAAIVFVARLVSAAVSDDFSASGELELDTVLKGSPPDRLAFDTNIGPLTSCGPDLIIGNPYLVFLIDGKPRLYLINDVGSQEFTNTIINWIAKKLQTP